MNTNLGTWWEYLMKHLLLRDLTGCHFTKAIITGRVGNALNRELYAQGYAGISCTWAPVAHTMAATELVPYCT